MSPKLIAWSLPFLGLGVACSQLSGNTNFARIAALGATTMTWIAAGVLETDWMDDKAPWIADLVDPLLPQAYMTDLWGPGTGWLLSGGILVGLGLVFSLLGFPLFARRNL